MEATTATTMTPLPAALLPFLATPILSFGEFPENDMKGKQGVQALRNNIAILRDTLAGGSPASQQPTDQLLLILAPGYEGHSPTQFTERLYATANTFVVAAVTESAPDGDPKKLVLLTYR